MENNELSSDLDYDNVGGNYYDKYGSTNPIARMLMNGFLSSFDGLIGKTGAKTAYEVGCGEGILSLRLAEHGLDVGGSDVDEEVVAEANNRALAVGRDQLFKARNLFDIRSSEANADIVVCCEVLEHIPSYSAALDHLATLTQNYLLVSVPREPIWRFLNMARGKYLRDLGNTPGHINHWSTGGFVQELSKRFALVEVRRPLPWTMVLCRARN